MALRGEDEGVQRKEQVKGMREYALHLTSLAGGRGGIRWPSVEKMKECKEKSR